MSDVPQVPSNGEAAGRTKWDAFAISMKFVHEAISSTPERPAWRVAVPKGTLISGRTVGEGDFASASFLVRGKQIRSLKSASETVLVRMPVDHECYVSIGTREMDGSLSFEPKTIKFGEIAHAIKSEADAWREARHLADMSEHSSVRADCDRVSTADNDPSRDPSPHPAEPRSE